MKFFKQEYLDYDYKDEIKRAEMNKLWKEACKSYSDYFRTIENSFSKRFIGDRPKNKKTRRRKCR